MIWMAVAGWAALCVAATRHAQKDKGAVPIGIACAGWLVLGFWLGALLVNPNGG